MAGRGTVCADHDFSYSVLDFCITGDPVIVSIIGFLPYIFAFFMAALNGRKWRKRIRDWLYSGDWSNAYLKLIDSIIHIINNFFGRPISIHSFNRCLSISLLYVILAYIYIDFYNKNYSSSEIFTHFLVFLLIFSISFFIIGFQISLRSTICLNYYALDIIVALYSNIVFVVIVENAIQELVFPIAFLAPLPIYIFYNRNSIVYFIAFFIILAYNERVGVIGLEQNIQKNIAILFILPLINAFFDWISWYISRYYISKIRIDIIKRPFRRRFFSLIKHVSLDIIYMITVFLFLLITIKLTHDGFFGLNFWREMSIARFFPFSSPGIAMTVMLISTVVPTALHVFLAVFALAAVRPPNATRAADKLQESNEGTEMGTQFVIALYLTSWTAFALAILWAAARVTLLLLDSIVGGTGFWRFIFRIADTHFLF